jgi:hypothetical protein
VTRPIATAPPLANWVASGGVAAWKKGPLADRLQLGETREAIALHVEQATHELHLRLGLPLLLRLARRPRPNRMPRRGCPVRASTCQTSSARCIPCCGRRCRRSSQRQTISRPTRDAPWRRCRRLSALTKASLDRALRLKNAVLFTVEAAGRDVKARPPRAGRSTEPSTTGAWVDGEFVALLIHEHYDMVPLPPLPKRRKETTDEALDRMFRVPSGGPAWPNYRWT